MISSIANNLWFGSCLDSLFKLMRFILSPHFDSLWSMMESWYAKLPRVTLSICPLKLILMIDLKLAISSVSCIIHSCWLAFFALLHHWCVQISYFEEYMANMNSRAYSKTRFVLRMWTFTWKWPEIQKISGFLAL